MARSVLFPVILILLSALFMQSGHTQESHAIRDSALNVLEKDLAVVARQILYGETDSTRLAASEAFQTQLSDALERTGSFRFPFDSLITVARLFAPDSSFRLFNWNLPKDDGTFLYYGVLQHRDAAEDTHLFTLTDRSDFMDDPEHLVTDHLSWPGAHYYQVILTSSNTQRYYTLLGWDGHTPQTTRKIIEVLTFQNDNTPVFGARIFPDYKTGDQTRVIFEYSGHASMSLKYDLQTYTAVKSQKAKHPRYKTITTRMIVFDHLEPMDPSLAERYSFYVPSGNVFDAFVFLDGAWRFHPDIDARNPESVDKNREKGQPEFELFPPVEKK